MTHNRVSIQYSIELDDLELETDRLLKNLQQQIRDLGPIVQGTSSSLSLETVEMISTLQHGLQSVSAAADDLQKIISGFLSFKLQSQTPAESAAGETEQAPARTPDQQLTLREQVSEYRKLLEHAVLQQQLEPDAVDDELKRQKIESFKENLSNGGE